MKRYLVPIVATLMTLVLLLVAQPPVMSQASIVGGGNPFTALQQRLDAVEQTVASLLARVTALEANAGSSGATRKVLTKTYDSTAPVPDESWTYYEPGPPPDPENPENYCENLVTVDYVKFSFPGRSTTDAPVLQAIAPSPASYGYAWNNFPPGARPVVTSAGDLFAVLDRDTGLDVLFRVRQHTVCDGSVSDNYPVPPDPDGKIRVTLVAIE